MSQATHVIQESAGFAPTGKYHLSHRGEHALCHAKPRMSANWNVRGDRMEFERFVPERICKSCRKVEQATIKAQWAAQDRYREVDFSRIT